MKKIVIGFSKSKKKIAIGSWLIRQYMQTPYSHVYLKFESKSLDRVLVYEAVGKGVRFIGLNNWSKDHEEVASFELEISDASYKKIMQFCIDNAGTEYGFWQNLGIVFANICKLMHNPMTDGENCSEAIGELLTLEGYTLNKDINLLTPKDIYLILNNQSI